MKHIFFALISLSLFATLTGCGDSNDVKAGNNRFVSHHAYDKLEIHRGRHSIAIELKSGDATANISDRFYRCIADRKLRTRLKDTLDQLSIIKTTRTCRNNQTDDFEVFSADFGTAMTVDGCEYEYTGDGIGLMDRLFGNYISFCTGGMPVARRDRRHRHN